MKDFNEEYQTLLCSLSLRGLEEVDDKIEEALEYARDPFPLAVAKKRPFFKKWLCFFW